MPKHKPHHVRATIKLLKAEDGGTHHATYLFDGDANVIGVVVDAQPTTPREEGGEQVMRRGHDVLINNMERKKLLQGKRCEYVWLADILWLIEPVEVDGASGGRVQRSDRPPPKIKVGNVPTSALAA